MARKFSTDTLKVKIQEAIVLNGQDLGSTRTISIPDVRNLYKRIITVPNTENQEDIINFSDTEAAGQFNKKKLAYIRITNLDDSEEVYFSFVNEAEGVFSSALIPGASYIFMPHTPGQVASSNFMFAHSPYINSSTALPNNSGIAPWYMGTVTGCSYNNGTTVNCDSHSFLAPGMILINVAGGFPNYAYVTQVNSPGSVTSFEISHATSGGSKTGQTLIISRTGPYLKKIMAGTTNATSELEIVIAEI
tara:strand:+ start:1929 stop:2672 length:744 start_codon:yes stop_codon:yes gene_type:complete